MKKIAKAVALTMALIFTMAQIPCMAGYWAYTSKDTCVFDSTGLFSKRTPVGVNTKVYVVKADGLFYKVKDSKKKRTGYILQCDISRSKVKTAKEISEITVQEPAIPEPWTSKVVKKNWFQDGKNVLKRGKTGQLYFIKTGNTANILRTGGHYHATCVAASSADRALVYKAIGKKWAWKVCPAILIAGGKYVAVSFEVDPDSKEIHIHMTGSKGHSSGKVSQAHQKTIEEAYNWARKKGAQDRA